MKKTVICCLAEIAAKKQTVPISIPNAIKRSPTDLLKALNSTVGIDKTAPHFSFIDDPTTIPTTAQQKKNYFLAKELGKRAARQLATEWPTLFMFDRDYPRLPAFRPEKLLDPLEVEPTEENLKKMVDAKNVEAAIRLYERLQSENVEVSNNLQTDLFHLVAYYNAKDVPLTEIEEWPGLRNFFSEGGSKWIESGIVDLLFEGSLKNSDAYSTMICALCKFKTEVSVVRARALFKEMLEKKLIPTEEVFNYLISVSSPKFMINILKQMNSIKITPSVRTFNACLININNIDGFAEKYKKIRQIVGEMKQLKIEPSLTTYSLILEALIPQKKFDEQRIRDELKVGVNLLDEILVKLEMGPFMNPVDSTDQFFFLNALRIATEANNADFVDRIEKLYSDRKNTVAMTALTTESVFYARYLIFKCGILKLDELEKLYKELVPRIVGTTRQLALLLTEKLSTEQKWSFSRRVIDDCVAARHLADARLASNVRKLLIAQDTFKMTLDEKEDYQKDVIKIVDACLEFANFTESHLKKLQIKLHPQAIVECGLLLIKADQYERAWELIGLLLDEDAKKKDDYIIQDSGYASHDCLLELFDIALAKNDWYNASHCIQLVSFYQPNANLEHMIVKIESKCNLTPIQRRILRNFAKLRQ